MVEVRVVSGSNRGVRSAWTIFYGEDGVGEVIECGLLEAVNYGVREAEYF